ncbi:MAG: STAS domain-containing protein [Candidatus Omnitrophica bacterium]|nr:STAS domain-containing protein [Candidatus Omnitrophota bacterium]
MQINSEKKNDISIIRVSGNVDIQTSPDMKKYLDKEITGENNKIVIDLKDVDYVDSSGLATLVEVLKSLRAVSGKLKLTNLSPKVKGLFEITKLNNLFDIYGDEEEALNSFE